MKNYADLGRCHPPGPSVLRFFGPSVSKDNTLLHSPLQKRVRKLGRVNFRKDFWDLGQGKKLANRVLKQPRRRRQRERQRSNRFRLAKQQLCTSRLRRGSALFHVSSETGTQDNSFLFFFLNFDSP